MRLENGGGDKLASGGVRANFFGPKVSKERWDDIWKPEVSDSDALPEAPGNGGTSAEANQADAGI